MNQDIQYDIFISYRRVGGEYFAKVLRDSLNELGYKVFFDVESLRSGDFNTRLYSVIDECTDFIVILSPGALDRCVNQDDWVRQEIERALEKEKNIIPVMLRDFDFPKEMPSPIEPLRFKSGVTANMELFDGFIRRLLNFLETKPPKRGSIRAKRVLAAFSVVCALLAAGLSLLQFFSSPDLPVYPQSQVEKNLTAEFIFHLQTCLTNYDMMAEAINDALDACKRHLSSGTADTASLSSQFEVSQHAMSNIDTSLFVPDDGLVDKLRDSPFGVDDVRAMQVTMVHFHDDWINHLNYLQEVMENHHGYAVMPNADKLQIIECYQTILTEDAKFTAYCSNKMLLPITSDDAMHDFLYEILPQFVHIPLSATTWSRDENALKSAEDEALTKQENALKKLTTLVGNTNMENNKLKKQLDNMWNGSSYMRPVPTEETDIDELWDMLRECNTHEDSEGALGCLTRMVDLLDSDSDAMNYLLPVIAYVKEIGYTTTGDGILVKGYYQPDGENPVLQVGDIIVGFNGELCVFYEDYMDRKKTLAPGEIYTLTVLRSTTDGLQETELTLTEDMPRVILEALSMKE